MRIIQVNPIETKSFNRYCDIVKKDCILVGKCHGSYYLSELTFKPILINQKEEITRAVLKMYCKHICGCRNPINVCINNENVNLDVYDKGICEWDVTNIVNPVSDHNLKLCVYTKDWISCCDIKQFEALDSNTGPVLELTIEDQLPNHKVVNVVKKYNSVAQLKYSDWIDTALLNNYYYFIKNLGTSDVEVLFQISPDKNLTIQDSGPFIIKANEVSYLQPMKESQFVRISYKNLCSSDANLISVWLQGKT